MVLLNLAFSIVDVGLQFYLWGSWMNELIWNTFKTVAEIGTISKAARHLNLSQSAVSQQIQQLEIHYQTPLFVRTPQGVTLTESGEVLYRYVNHLLRTMQESRQALMQLKEQQPSSLAIGASLTIAEYMLPRILPMYSKPPWDIRITLSMANSRTVFEQMRHHEIDLGLVEAPLSDPQLNIRPFYEDHPVVVVSANHRWKHRKTVSLDELLQEPFLLREPGSGTRMSIEEGLGHVEASLQNLNIRLVLGTTQAIKSMILNNVGVSILSPLTIQPIERHLFHFVTVAELNLRRNFFIAHHRDLSSRTAHHFIHSLLAKDWSVYENAGQPSDN